MEMNFTQTLASKDLWVPIAAAEDSLHEVTPSRDTENENGGMDSSLLKERVEHLETEMNTLVEKRIQPLEKEVSGIRLEMRLRFEHIDQRFAQVERRLDKIDDRLDKLDRDLKKIYVTVIIPLLMGFLGLATTIIVKGFKY